MGNSGADIFRNIHLCLCGCAEAQSVLAGADDLVQHFRVVVTQNHGSPGTDIINIAAAVCVYHIGSCGALDKTGRHSHIAAGTHR